MRLSLRDALLMLFVGAAPLATPVAQEAASDHRAHYQEPQESAKFRSLGNIDILTDTEGVDLEPYLAQVVRSVRENWYPLVPEDAASKKGQSVVEFSITRTGQIEGLRVFASAGDPSLDEAAISGMSACNPFAPLPTDLRGPSILLRAHFYYNPDVGDIQQTYPPLGGGSERPLVHVVPPLLIASSSSADAAVYPPEALAAKKGGVVQVDVAVDANGKVTKVSVLTGGTSLSGACKEAVRHWRFHPAQREGLPVEGNVRVACFFEPQKGTALWHLVDPSPIPSQGEATRHP